MEETQEILKDFLIKASEMVEQLDQNLIELENNPTDLEFLNKIFLLTHTIKGSSSFLNFDTLTHLTHNMEDVLNKAPQIDSIPETINAQEDLMFGVGKQDGRLVTILKTQNPLKKTF